MTMGNLKCVYEYPGVKLVKKAEGSLPINYLSSCVITKCPEVSL